MPRIEGEPYYERGGVTLIQGDCLTILGAMPKVGLNLVFADPPFNVGLSYDNCVDKLSKPDYLAWTEAWLKAVKGVLLPSGSLYVCSGAKYQAEIKILMDDVGFHWQNTIIWHYTFGPHQKRKFTPSWVAIHFATMHPTEFTWNRDAVLVPSARQTRYGDKRASAGGKTPDNVWVLDPSQLPSNRMMSSEDFLVQSRVCGTFKERTGHPCQMPTAILERIIRVSTNVGDAILDPFLGSGTTAVVCQRLGRKCVGIELSKSYLDEFVIPRLKC